MEFQLVRINPGKLLLLVLAGSTGGVLVILGLPLLDSYGSFGAASVATFLFLVAAGYSIKACSTPLTP